MGLIADIESATRTAGELEATTRKQVTDIGDLEQLITTHQGELTEAVEGNQKALKDMSAALSDMNTTLHTAFQTFNMKIEELNGQVTTLRSDVIADLETNHKAVTELMPQVQATFDLIEKGVTKACDSLKELVTEDARLVQEAEDRANEAWERARAVETAVTAQHQALLQLMPQLEDSWKGLNSQFDGQLKVLEEGFAAANLHLATKLTSRLNEIADAATKCDDSVYNEVMTTTTAELEKLAVTLGQALTDLRKAGDRPKLFVETELTDLTNKLKKILAVLVMVENNIYKKASSNGLFDF